MLFQCNPLGASLCRRESKDCSFKETLVLCTLPLPISKIKPLQMAYTLKFITSAYTSPVQQDLQPAGRAGKLFKDESFS